MTAAAAAGGYDGDEEAGTGARFIELFAGVGGFRVGLEASGGAADTLFKRDPQGAGPAEAEAKAAAAALPKPSRLYRAHISALEDHFDAEDLSSKCVLGRLAAPPARSRGGVLVDHHHSMLDYTKCSQS